MGGAQVQLTKTNTGLWCRDKQVLVALLCRVCSCQAGEASGPELRGNCCREPENLHFVRVQYGLATEQSAEVWMRARTES